MNFLDEDEVVFFPSDELLRAETLSSSRELLSQRLYALGQLRNGTKHKILITHPSALLRFLPNPKRFDEETITFRVGDTYDLSKLKARLVDIGYTGNDKIERSLQFASRGDILDIYSPSYSDPMRVEFFGDEIESIRFFDLSTQQSKLQAKEAVCLPASDIFLNDDELSAFALKAKEQLEKDVQELGPDVGRLLSNHLGDDIEKFIQHNYQNGLYRYYGFANPKAASVLEYFAPDIVYICNEEKFDEAVTMLDDEAHSYFGELFYKGKTISHLEEYMKKEKAFASTRRVIASHSYAEAMDDILFPVHKISVTNHNVATIPVTIQSYLATNERLVLCLKEPHQKSTVIGFLNDLKIPFVEVKGWELPEKGLAISDAFINEGFEIPSLKLAYISSGELFGKRNINSRFASRFKDAHVLRSYEDLKPGDYVVHEYNGIGQFLDIKTIEVEGVHRDFLHIAYAGNEFLYVPLEQFRLVRKYAGREGATPKLSHLSSGEWNKRKAKIKERINDLADRLLALYGARAKSTGYAFPQDDELQKSFEDEFPYELTPDQAKAVTEIKEDMEKPEIMDRLLCGDVGFGKTEVAFRAAFKAIDAGKQVALLCPTTLLARQHYELAQQRFSSFGIKIAVFSRLVPEIIQKENIEAILRGEVNLVIGTHRLLSKEIIFKDLGLLIIDEEQRFGVEQKEKIKEIKKSVDVLTLSATPIPRTLQMSLVGIRALSQINTAPSARMPIQTYVTPYRVEAVDELINRELARDGQVFYVHNKVATIYNTASKLAARIPAAQIGVVHGQMDKEQTEEVMAKFYDGELNVLVCTSIVENGIDIPNANMIIVEDADTFGLSQLYQIKGRVGRGSRIAYAYLMYKQRKDLNDNAMKRLQAIQEFTELGSGYKIAQRDLMIRGAGDILGPEQAGFIDSVGLDLYLKMLNEAVEEKKTGVVAAPPVAKKLFKLDAYIPSDYASKEDKLELYQELENAKTDKDVQAFTKKMRDIYGRLPEEVTLLIQKKRIDVISDNEEFTSIVDEGKKVDIFLSNAFSSIDGIGSDLFSALIPYISILRVTFIEKKLRISLEKREKWLDDLEKVVKEIHHLYDSRKKRQEGN